MEIYTKTVNYCRQQIDMAARLDVIIFGASGFTGKVCVVEAVSVLKNYTWGIAGRNKKKLEQALKDAERQTGSDLSKVPILIADVDDEKAVAAMAESAKVIVNCCGPYRFYGEQVVKACIKAGTHHVDISGEAQYMERMQLEYDEMARENNAYIVSACGLDSIPVDVGVQHIENNFDGNLNSVESYLETWIEGPQLGTSVNYGTWASLVNMAANIKELKEIRSKLFKDKMPETLPKLKTRFSILKTALIKAYAIPFPGVDEPVVERSQRILYETEGKRPVQVKCYMAFRSLIQTIGFSLAMAFVFIFSQFAITRLLLLTFPRIFSLGFVSKDGPSKERMKNTKFNFTLHAKGWAKGDTSHLPNKKLVLNISGYNPGYGATSVALLTSAKTILNESNKMPSTGGVYPPGAAFGKTNIVTELGKYESGFHFKFLYA